MCSIHILIADPMMKHPNAVLATQNKTIECIREMSLKSMVSSVCGKSLTLGDIFDFFFFSVSALLQFNFRKVTYLGIVKELPIMQVRNPGTVCLKHEQFS